jgi:hypothetical protein
MKESFLKSGKELFDANHTAETDRLQFAIIKSSPLIAYCN